MRLIVSRGRRRCDFARPPAQIRNQASLAQRTPSHTDVASVQNEPVMGMWLVIRRDDILEFHLDLERCRTRCKAGPVGHAKNVSVDRDRGLPEGNVEDHVRGFAAHPGQGFERLAGMGDFSAMLFHQLFRQADEIFRLGAKEADGLDELLQARFTQRQHLGRGVGNRKQRRRSLVYSCIRRLCR